MLRCVLRHKEVPTDCISMMVDIFVKIAHSSNMRKIFFDSNFRDRMLWFFCVHQEQMFLTDFKKFCTGLNNIKISNNTELGDLFIDSFKKKFIAEFDKFIL